MYKHKILQIGDLVTNEQNTRTHSEQQINQIVNSIKEWGFTNPILIDENNSILAGHGRFLAAQQLGQKNIPCVVLDGLTEIQKRAYVIADNKLALNAGWDFRLLMIELEDLSNNYEIDLIGFDSSELDAILGTNEETNPDNKDVFGDRNLLQVETKTENDAEELYEELTERGYECKILL